MHYPVLEIDLNKLRRNTAVELDFFRKHGIEVMGVNKVFNGLYETAEAVVQGGMKTIAESRLPNLAKLKDLPCEKALLRSPGLSEVSDVIRYADISLAAEITAIEALSKEAVRQGRTHQILLMVDMGDLREGIWYQEKEELAAAAAKILELPGVALYGLGTNFGCYGTVLATEKNAKEFVAVAKELEDTLSIKLKYLSGGNCSSYRLVEQGTMPEEINHLRIGAQHAFGIEYVEGRYLEGYYHSKREIEKYVSDAYILKGEIIELRRKPTVPVGELGMDSFMNRKVFPDLGVRKQGILSFGRQEVPWENIHPTDEKIRVMGQTSNHTLIDVEDAEREYCVGDIVPFEIDYTALLYLCNTAGLDKIFTDKDNTKPESAVLIG